MCIQSLTNVSHHIIIPHGVPNTVRTHDNEFPLTVQVEGLNLRHSADHLFPRWLFMFGFQQKIAKTPRWNKNASNSVKTIQFSCFHELFMLVVLMCVHENRCYVIFCLFSRLDCNNIRACWTLFDIILTLLVYFLAVWSADALVSLRG